MKVVERCEWSMMEIDGRDDGEDEVTLDDFMILSCSNRQGCYDKK